MNRIIRNRMSKKQYAGWIVVAVIIGAIIGGLSSITPETNTTNLTAPKIYNNEPNPETQQILINTAYQYCVTDCSPYGEQGINLCNIVMNNNNLTANMKVRFLDVPDSFCECLTAGNSNDYCLELMNNYLTELRQEFGME